MSNRYSIPVPPYTIVKYCPMAKKGQWTEDFDIRHALKFGLYPHVSNALDFGDEGLTKHKISRAVFFSAIHQYRGKTDEEHKLDKEDFKEYLSHILKFSGEELGAFADQGKELHAKVARFYEGNGYPADHEGAQNVIATLAPRLKSLGVVRVACEHKLVNEELGFVGTPDLVGFNSDEQVVWQGDEKQVNNGAYEDFKTSKSLYESWRGQLALYSILNKSSGHAVDQILSNRQTNECKLIAHDNHDTMIQAMEYHIKGWMMRKYGCFPSTIVKEKRAELEPIWKQIADYNKGRIEK